MHLASALRIAEVENFVLTSGILNSCDVGRIIVQTHIGPGPVPVLGVARRIVLNVIPTVHSSSVVADPNVVTSVHKL